MHAVPLELTADGEKSVVDSLIVLIFNGETAGGFRLARRSSLRDGQFDCIVLEKRDIFTTLWTMLRDLRDAPTDADGQKGARFPLHVECLAGELRVVCPSRG